MTDIVSSLGFSWWQGGPPHTQTLKDLNWVSTHTEIRHRPFILVVVMVAIRVVLVVVVASMSWLSAESTPVTSCLNIVAEAFPPLQN